MTTPLPLTTEFLFRLSLAVGAPQSIGRTGETELRIVPVTGGTATGPHLNATVLPGTAADWLRIEADGTAHMDVRLTLQATSGELIYMHYRGLRTGPAEVLARLNAGAAVDPATYYFRIAVRFETAAPAHLWLNRLLAIGVGQRPPAGPIYDIYAIR